MIVITPPRLTTKSDANEASCFNVASFLSRVRVSGRTFGIANSAVDGYPYRSSHFVFRNLTFLFSHFISFFFFIFYFVFIFICLSLFFIFLSSSFFFSFSRFFFLWTSESARRRMHKTSVRGGRTKAF